MDQRISAGRTPSNQTADRGMSEKLFIFAGLAIVLGGIWMLYMGNAPYHPDINSTDTQVLITVDS